MALADRRMFAKTIIDSDAFLDMPLTAQALYFHLSMRGDDDGFINNPKKIQRMIGASDDDLKLLIAKNFIIPFESGIVVIKHWKIHNYIRGDRKKETVYPEEMSLLVTKENGSYTLASEIQMIEPMPNVNCLEEPKKTARQLAYEESSLPYSFDYKIRQAFHGKVCPICGFTMEGHVDECGIGSDIRRPSIQHNKPISKGGKHELGNISVICKKCNITLQDTETGDLNALEVIEVWEEMSMSGKCQSSDSQVTGKCQHRIGKDRIELGKVRKVKVRKVKAIDYNSIKDAYNTLCPSLPSIKILSDTRKRSIKTILNKYTVEQLEKAFSMAEQSNFLSGRCDGSWRANFDWIMKDANLAKILDGNYENRANTNPTNKTAKMLDGSYQMMKDWSES